MANLLVLCLALFMGVGAEADVLDDIHRFSADAKSVETALCNPKTFGPELCASLLADLRSGKDIASVRPTVVAKNPSEFASLREFSNCDLPEDPFHYEDSDGIVATPAGPFELFRELPTESGQRAALISVTGYYSPEWDPGSVSYAWKSFYRLMPEDPCNPVIMGFSSYGGTDRPAEEFHEDGVVIWRQRALILTVWEIGKGLVRIDVYATHKPRDVVTSQVAAFDITTGN